MKTSIEEEFVKDVPKKDNPMQRKKQSKTKIIKNLLKWILKFKKKKWK